MFKNYMLFPITMGFIVICGVAYMINDSKKNWNQLWIETCVVPRTHINDSIEQRNRVSADCIAYYSWLLEQRKVWRNVN